MTMMHSFWAYLALVLLLVTVLKAVTSLKKEFKNIDLRLALFTLIVLHIQLLLGLGVYFSSPAYKSLKANGMSGIDSYTRLLAVEHPILMLVAIVLITIGYSKHKKKTTAKSKFKTIAIFYGIALLLVLTRIPWGQWF
ncbi:MAG: hypothetical protein L3J23_06765 [Flavobacteriaceae bacterium]|nr:hypothetical protein [Flavobacteriaceae bacterium]